MLVSKWYYRANRWTLLDFKDKNSNEFVIKFIVFSGLLYLIISTTHEYVKILNYSLKYCLHINMYDGIS